MFSLHTLLAHKLTTLYTKRAFHQPLGEGEGEALLLDLYCKNDGHSKPMFQKHNKNVAFIQTLTDN